MAGTAAFFDVDGTLTRSDIFRDLMRFRSEQQADVRSRAWLATAPFRAGWLLMLDRWSRAASNRAVYRSYRGFRPDELSAWAARFQAREGLARTFPRGLDLLRRHAELGHALVLVTGSLRPIIEPLARRLEPLLPEGSSIRVEAVSLAHEEGRFTGELDGPPLSGEAKADVVRRIVAEGSLDITTCHAYGDSISDRNVLEAVGRPAAVNPCTRLRRLALAKGWPILELDGGLRE